MDIRQNQLCYVGRRSDDGRLLPSLLTKAWRSPNGTLSETATPFFVSLNALAEELKPLLWCDQSRQSLSRSPSSDRVLCHGS